MNATQNTSITTISLFFRVAETEGARRLLVKDWLAFQEAWEAIVPKVPDSEERRFLAHFLKSALDYGPETILTADHWRAASVAWQRITKYLQPPPESPVVAQKLLENLNMILQAKQVDVLLLEVKRNELKALEEQNWPQNALVAWRGVAAALGMQSLATKGSSDAGLYGLRSSYRWDQAQAVALDTARAAVEVAQEEFRTWGNEVDNG